MFRDNFSSLLDILHKVDPFSKVPNEKLWYFETFMKHFRSKCKNLLQPYQNIATKERLEKSKDRSDIRQYLANKPVKFDLKL